MVLIIKFNFTLTKILLKIHKKGVKGKKWIDAESNLQHLYCFVQKDDNFHDCSDNLKVLAWFWLV